MRTFKNLHKVKRAQLHWVKAEMGKKDLDADFLEATSLTALEGRDVPQRRLTFGPARESAGLTRIKDSNTQLQTENARLSVDVGSQITSLKTQHVALQLANSQLAAEKDTLLKDIDSLQQEHKHALQDQVTLQCLHDQLSAEYESLNKDKEQLKAAVRDLRQEMRDTREQQTALEQRIDELTTQNNNMKTCSEDLTILRTEHSKLTEDFRNLFAPSVLLAICFEDKKHFHEKEKNYTERVHSLKRQKEKLEKIMEHYKKTEVTVHKKKKPFAIGLVRRVKKASSDLMNKVPSRNRRSWVDDFVAIRNVDGAL